MDNSQIKENIAKQINSSFDFRKLLAAVISGWYWFVLALIFAGAAAFLYLRYTTPVYAVHSSLLVEDKNDVSSKVLSILGPSASKTDVNLYNEIFQLRSQDLVRAAVDSLLLNVH